jgi:predicted ATPase
MRRPQMCNDSDCLIGAYSSLGYDIHVLPKVSVAERADWILASLTR